MPNLRNPMPHLAEASSAATRLIALKRDLFFLENELKAVRQMRRIGFGIAALMSLTLLLLVATLWITVSLYRAGWSPGAIAALAFLFFAGTTIFLARKALAGEARHQWRIDESRIQAKRARAGDHSGDEEA